MTMEKNWREVYGDYWVGKIERWDFNPSDFDIEEPAFDSIRGAWLITARIRFPYEGTETGWKIGDFFYAHYSPNRDCLDEVSRACSLVFQRKWDKYHN